MTALFLSNILLALVVSVCVFVANPRRRSNRILAVDFTLLALWLACVYQVVQSEFTGTNPAGWIRANIIVASGFPPLTWFLRDAIVSPHAPLLDVLRRALPWLGLTAIAVSLPFFDAFLLPPAYPGGPHGRGWPYYTFIGVELFTYACVLAPAIWSARRQTGIKRLEFQFSFFA